MYMIDLILILLLVPLVADFDGKVMAIRSLLEPKDGEKRIPKRSDGDPSKKQEILKILDQLKRSYSSLAESHDQLRSNTKGAIASAMYDDPRMGDSSDPESAVDNPHDSDLEIKPVHEVILPELTDKVPEVISTPVQEYRVLGFSEWEKSEEQCKFEVIRLIEENIRAQAELVRRNEEKQGTIEQLRSEIEGLKTEVRTLVGCLTSRKIDLKRTSSKTSPIKMLTFGAGAVRKIIRSFSRDSP